MADFQKEIEQVQETAHQQPQKEQATTKPALVTQAKPTEDNSMSLTGIEEMIQTANMEIEAQSAHLIKESPGAN